MTYYDQRRCVCGVKEVGKNRQTLIDIRSMACRRSTMHAASYKLPMRAFYQPSTRTQDPSAQHNQPDTCTPQRTDSTLHTESDIACAAANVIEEYARRPPRRLQLNNPFTHLADW